MDRLLRIFCLCGLLLSTAVCKADASDLEIMSDRIGSDGIVSAYESYVFVSTVTVNGNVSAPQWSYCLYGKDGKAVEVKTADSMSFEIDSIADPDAYQITEGCYLTGFVKFRCLVDGVEREANPFVLKLDLKPVIKISDVKIVKGVYSRSLSGHAQCLSADNLFVEVEEDYATSVSVINYSKYLPSVDVFVDHITFFYKAWVDFKASNKYGLTVETIELEPDYTPRESGIDKEVVDAPVSVQAFDVQGRFLGAFDSVEQAKSELARGLYIFKIFENRKESKVMKVAL